MAVMAVAPHLHLHHCLIPTTTTITITTIIITVIPIWPLQYLLPLQLSGVHPQLQVVHLHPGMLHLPQREVCLHLRKVMEQNLLVANLEMEGVPKGMPESTLTYPLLLHHIFLIILQRHHKLK